MMNQAINQSINQYQNMHYATVHVMIAKHAVTRVSVSVCVTCCVPLRLAVLPCDFACGCGCVNSSSHAAVMASAHWSTICRCALCMSSVLSFAVACCSTWCRSFCSWLLMAVRSWSMMCRMWVEAWALDALVSDTHTHTNIHAHIQRKRKRNRKRESHMRSIIKLPLVYRSERSSITLSNKPI